MIILKHSIGTGGSSMSGLAGMLALPGFTGSTLPLPYDRRWSSRAFTFIGQRAENVDGADIVIYSAAIAKSNP